MFFQYPEEKLSNLSHNPTLPTVSSLTNNDGLVKSRKTDFLPQHIGIMQHDDAICCGQNKMLGLFTRPSIINNDVFFIVLSRIPLGDLYLVVLVKPEYLPSNIFRHEFAMLEIIDVLNERWVYFVEHSADTTVFHHPFWSVCLSSSYGYRPFVIVMKDSDDMIIAGLPVMEINSWLTGKRWVSLPFSDHCSPLVQNEDDFDFFTNELINTCKALSAPKVEIRQCLPSVEGFSNGKLYFIHHLKLNNKPEELYKRFRKKGVQYCIKKAAKSGIDILQSSELESLLTFYNLHLMTRKKHGVPIQPQKYFLKLWEHVIKQDMGFVMLAHYKGKAIAGGVFLHFNNNLIYKYGATDPNFMNLYATHALLWEAIQWGCKNGYQVMDWGKTEKSNEGLRKFKLGWGTEEKELCYSYIGKESTEYLAGWKQKVVENTIRKSPLWVGRLLGEILYKHVG